MGGLFKTPKPPAAPEPAPIPDVDDEAVARARRRSLAASRNRSGVASTVRPAVGGALGQSPAGADTVLGGAFRNFTDKTLGGGR